MAVLSATMEFRKNTLKQTVGGNKGCLTPNEHPSMLGNYSPSGSVPHPAFSPVPDARFPNPRKPYRSPPSGDKAQTAQATTRAASEKHQIPVFDNKVSQRSGQRAGGRAGGSDGARHAGTVGGCSADAPRGLTPIPPRTTYQNDYQIIENGEMQEINASEQNSISSAGGGDKVSNRGSKSMRDERRSHRSHRAQSLELDSVRTDRSGSTATSRPVMPAAASERAGTLTARALAELEAIEEERERVALRQEQRASSNGPSALPPPPLTPVVNPHTGQEVRAKHRHLYLPIHRQLEQIVNDKHILSPVTSAPVTDRSHMVGAAARAAQIRGAAEDRGARAAESQSGSASARSVRNDRRDVRFTGGGVMVGEKEVRVKLLTSKMMRSRPIGENDGTRLTGAEMLNEVEKRDAKRSAAQEERTRKAAASSAAYGALQERERTALASGLRWKRLGNVRPQEGIELTQDKHGKLLEAARRKLEHRTVWEQDSIHFTQEEWAAVGPSGLLKCHFLQAGPYFYKPASAGVRWEGTGGARATRGASEEESSTFNLADHASDPGRPGGKGNRAFAAMVKGHIKGLPTPTGVGYGAVGNEGDRHAKSRGVEIGGANIETQLVISPSLLRSRFEAKEERQRRRARKMGGHAAREETPVVSPCARAFVSIQTDSMMGYDSRAVAGLPNDGRPWRFTPPPPPYTPPTPQLLHASPRTVSRDHYASPAGKVALKPVTLKVGAVGMEGSPRK